jgi:hypothetical protein
MIVNTVFYPTTERLYLISDYLSYLFINSGQRHNRRRRDALSPLESRHPTLKVRTLWEEYMAFWLGPLRPCSDLLAR